MPTNLSVISESYDTLTASWISPQPHEDHAPVDEYEIDYRLVTSQKWSTIRITSNQTQFVISRLNPYTNYQVKIKAISTTTNPSFGHFSASTFAITQQSG